jgi:hypothetical protein
VSDGVRSRPAMGGCLCPIRARVASVPARDALADQRARGRGTAVRCCPRTIRVERRASGEASSVMARGEAGAAACCVLAVGKAGQR